jgi:hypothetical protein
MPPDPVSVVVPETPPPAPPEPLSVRPVTNPFADDSFDVRPVHNLFGG